MSLINKMLNDLEKRNAFLNENADQVLDGLYSAYDLELTNKKKSNTVFTFFVCLISVAIIIVATCISLDKKNSQVVTENKEFTAEKESPAREDVKTNIVSDIDTSTNIEKTENKAYQSLKLDDQLNLENESETLSLVQTRINRIESIQFETDSSSVNLIMKMPDEIDYLVYSLSNPDRTVIEVENVELGFRLEDLKPVEPIVAIRYSINDEKRFKLVLESDMPLTIRKSVTGTSGNVHDLIVMMEYQWQEKETLQQDDVELAAIVEQQVALEKGTVFKGDLIKTPVNQSTNAYAEKLFQQAYMAYQRGNTSESLKKLNMALNQDPGHIKARSTLALVLSEKEHFELAYSVLNEGLIQYPDNIEWIKMYARLLLNEGKIVEARSMLDKQQPALALNAEYYALQAAVLQKLNEHEEAARVYRDLLHVNPLKGVWWMGLGISLESLKRYDDALYAYQKASKNSSLAKDSREFLMQRINRLSNILEDEST
jgi:tetratricopeptide (TPR) repeat protein